MVNSMRNSLKLINNERGHVLVFVLVSASLIFILFTGAVKLSLNAIREAEIVLDQLEVETLLQMSQVDLLKLSEETNEGLDINHYYKYPQGEITVRLDHQFENKYLLFNSIRLNNQSIYETAYEIKIK